MQLIWTSWYKEVNCTKPSPSVRLPWILVWNTLSMSVFSLSLSQTYTHIHTKNTSSAQSHSLFINLSIHIFWKHTHCLLIEQIHSFPHTYTHTLSLYLSLDLSFLPIYIPTYTLTHTRYPLLLFLQSPIHTYTLSPFMSVLSLSLSHFLDLSFLPIFALTPRSSEYRWAARRALRHSAIRHSA